MPKRKVVLAIALCGSLTPMAASGDCMYFLYALDSHSTVPSSDASGRSYSAAFLCGDFHLTGSVTVETTETVTGVHIHGPANADENGPLLYTLPPLIAGRVGFDVGPISEAVLHEIDLRRVYTDVHTVEHPQGAFRGIISGEVAVAPGAWGGVKTLYR